MPQFTHKVSEHVVIASGKPPTNTLWSWEDENTLFKNYKRNYHSPSTKPVSYRFCLPDISKILARQ